MTDRDKSHEESKRELATVAVLCLFVVVFLSAIGIAPHYTHRPAEAEIRALAEKVAIGRECGVPERDIGRLVLDRIREIGRIYPELPQNEIIAQLASTTSSIEVSTGSLSESCTALSLVR